MANDDHIAQLKKGVAAWNAWREENRNIRPDLSGADLSKMFPKRTNLSRADLSGADLSGANLSGANLSGLNLNQANLHDADLTEANLGVSAPPFLVPTGWGGPARQLAIKLFHTLQTMAATGQAAELKQANLSAAHLTRANLMLVDLREADLTVADLREARLMMANLERADLAGADLTGADLRQADLTKATLLDTDLTGADLTDCRIYGTSSWNLKLANAKQHNLVITGLGEPEITVDNIEVAQFMYLLLHNEKIREVIDSSTAKTVLILGRFTDERKAVLDALRDELRKRDYLPILFDFAVPATRDITETVSLLARMARFIIADLTDPSSIPKELEAIVPSLAVPVQPLLEGSSRPYAMFKDYWKYEWVLPVYRYEGLEPLLATIAEKVIAPAEGKVKALAERRRMIEAELTKAQ